MCEPKVLKSGGKKTGKDILRKSPKLVESKKKCFEFYIFETFRKKVILLSSRFSSTYFGAKKL
jgi:hypothetical protein